MKNLYQFNQFIYVFIITFFNHIIQTLYNASLGIIIYSSSYKFCNICFIKKTNMKNHIAVVPSHECNTDIQLSISKSCTKRLSESVTTKRKGVK